MEIEYLKKKKKKKTELCTSVPTIFVQDCNFHLGPIYSGSQKIFYNGVIHGEIKFSCKELVSGFSIWC